MIQNERKVSPAQLFGTKLTELSMPMNIMGERVLEKRSITVVSFPRPIQVLTDWWW